MSTKDPPEKALFDNNTDVDNNKIDELNSDSIDAEDKNKKPFTIVAIGASAGGLEAITQLIQNLTPDTGMAYIYVQHLSPDHESILTTLLSKVTEMKVQDIENMDKMFPNNVYVIPYNKEIKVTDGHIQLLPRPHKSYNLTIDILFSSLAETHKENVIGIVLSGSANDGTLGLKKIKQYGGITMAQDDSAKFGSMPNSAITEGVVDFILSPKDIANKLIWISKHPMLMSNNPKYIPEEEIDNNDVHLVYILKLLNKHKAVDFSQYKMNTIKRRIIRRMVINQTKNLKRYADLIDQNRNEIEFLYQDLLINVTEFFRDTDAFLILKENIFPNILKNKLRGEQLRIWVIACATGEEVYSIAILLTELQDNNSHNIPFQIFASDLSEEAIKYARIGTYTRLQLKNVSDQRLQRFFTKFNDSYSITKQLRDTCIFATHNILRDPPFSRMDFISCRNMLIYLDTAAQKRVIETIHYALNDEGCLLLGKSESIGTSFQLFGSSLDKKFKIYSKKKNSDSRRITPISTHKLQTLVVQKTNEMSTLPNKSTISNVNLLGNAFDSFLLDQYVPASVIINHDLEILQFRGDTSPFLQNARGKASLNILKMVINEITFELRNAIHHSIKTNQAVIKKDIELIKKRKNSNIQCVSIEVSPLKLDGEEDLLIIIFVGIPFKEISENLNTGENINDNAKDRRIKKLEEEIASARNDMASITQDQEAANEELQSANEEIVSSNEELQSLNEELETSKEEIESTNEELITTNQELQARIHQVEEMYTYYEAILSTVHEPMLVLYKDMRIKSVNKAFCKIFQVLEDECVGFSLYKLGNNQWDIPRLRELMEDIFSKNKHIHDFEVELTFPVIGLKTMLLNAHRIHQQNTNEEFIVLTILDITQIKKMAIALQEKEKKVLEVKLEIEKKALKKIEFSNIELTKAKSDAESNTKIAEEAVKSKQQFLSNMSHEIRTPMNAIIGFTNVMLKTKLDDTQIEYLNAIKISGDALIILINDILDLAKVNSGKMTFERTPFNLLLSVTSMLHLFDQKIREKNLILLKDYDSFIPQLVIGDPMRLRQIIINLVSNAVKFTHEGKITMGIHILKQDKKNITIEFCLTDTGIGIPQNKLKSIFVTFEQATRSTSRSYGGSGLGLAIVKQLVELQGGELIVKSELGKGSTFGFVMTFEKTLPEIQLANGNTEGQVEKYTTIENLKDNLNILIVEDLPLNQLLIRIIILEFGFTFELAENGKIAIEKMQKNNFDIILMDLQMPEMDGFEATQYIRKIIKSDIPIIALTADVTSVDVEKCLSVGMNDYISKPIDEKLLYSKILKFVKKQLV